MHILVVKKEKRIVSQAAEELIKCDRGLSAAATNMQSPNIKKTGSFGESFNFLPHPLFIILIPGYEGIADRCESDNVEKSFETRPKDFTSLGRLMLSIILWSNSVVNEVREIMLESWCDL